MLQATWDDRWARIGGAHAIGGDDAILKQVLEKAEAQGVGRAC